jgi:exosortase
MNLPTTSSDRPAVWRAAALTAGFGAVLAWVYLPVWQAMADKWANDPQYSHGYLVPAFSAVLLWLRRGRLTGVRIGVDGRGLSLILVGCLAYVVGGVINFDWLAAASLLPTLAGLVLLAGGWAALRWAWPAIGFLVFMMPLPFRVETALAQPLQSMATAASTFVLQMIGLPAFAEGNVIVLSRGRIGVVEACSGLSMLMIFLALAVGLVLVVRRPGLDKAVILLSAAPIAVIANVIRITATGLAQEWAGPDLADRIFHDWAGWLMMPLALALLGCELWVLSHALMPIPERRPLPPLPLPATASAARPQGRPKGRRGG